MDRTQIVDDNFRRRVLSQDFPPGPGPGGTLQASHAERFYRAAVLSRALDIKAREMQRAGQGFYTIGSSGHEAVSVFAGALRPTDIAFLHYRDAAFQIARADQVPGQNIAWDMLLSFAAAREDPISGGRHKVLGSQALTIPPQTSTIASHLPKAVGTAFSIALAKRTPLEHRRLADDGVVFCSFGDASVNHSTAQGALNAACWAAYQSTPMPILFLCADNGIGISTKTPKGWIAANYRNRPELKYFHCDGRDLYKSYAVACEAVNYIRKWRKPAFVHLETIRLCGHAGADLPMTYLSKAQVEKDEADDPLLHFVRQLTEADVLSSQNALDIYCQTQRELDEMAARAVQKPALQGAADVMSTIVPPPRECQARALPSSAARMRAFGKEFSMMDQPQIMSRLINWALTDLMLTHSEIVTMGEDIGVKGGVYGVTQKLQTRFGANRVIDTLLDEQTILGLAIGMAHNGFIPVPEIQFLAYYHNAEDQIRGEAATLPFFSQGQFTNPMVIRIAGLGYQRGFGGHFHNDNALAVLRDIPGLILACPSRGDDAVKMLRECVRLAREEQRVVVFVEPIALYGMRDLHMADDAGWMCHYPQPGETIGINELGITGQGPLALVSFGNGHVRCQQAAEALRKQNIATRVIDLRWLAPLPVKQLVAALSQCRHVLVVDETRRSGGVAEGIMAFLCEQSECKIARVTAQDSFIATGPAYDATLPSANEIVSAAIELCKCGE